MLSWTDPTESPLTTLALPSWEQGLPTDPVEVWLWAHRGEPEAPAADQVLVQLQAESPTHPGTWLTTGLPPLDELWARVRIVGVTARGQASFTIPLTEWRPFGTTAPLPLGTIPADCAIHLQLRLEAPAYGTPGPYRFRLAEISGLTSRPLPPLLTALGQGILTHAGDPATSAVLRGCQLLPEDPASDTVTVEPGMALFQGLPLGFAGTSETLNQQDGAGEPLTPGQHFWAGIFLSPASPGPGASHRVEKGPRGADPPKPTPTPGEVLAGYAQILHQPGGTTVLESQHLSLPAWARHRAIPGTGLQITLSAGEVLGPSSWRFWHRPTTIPLPDEATTWLWQLQNGGFTTTPAGDPPPKPTALGPLWQATTTAGTVTNLKDLRPYAGRTITLRAAGPPPPVGQALETFHIEEGLLLWESTILRTTEAPTTATAGATQVQVLVNGIPQHPEGPPDLRPTVAYDDATLLDRTAVHQSGVLRRGDQVGIQLAALPTGGSPAGLEVLLICRLP